MASETLNIKEERLGAAIDVIRAGLAALGDKVPPRTRALLEMWCAEMAGYLVGVFEREFWPTRERELMAKSDTRGE